MLIITELSEFKEYAMTTANVFHLGINKSDLKGAE